MWYNNKKIGEKKDHEQKTVTYFDFDLRFQRPVDFNMFRLPRAFRQEEKNPRSTLGDRIYLRVLEGLHFLFLRSWLLKGIFIQKTSKNMWNDYCCLLLFLRFLLTLQWEAVYFIRYIKMFYGVFWFRLLWFIGMKKQNRQRKYGCKFWWDVELLYLVLSLVCLQW